MEWIKNVIEHYEDGTLTKCDALLQIITLCVSELATQTTDMTEKLHETIGRDKFEEMFR